MSGQTTRRNYDPELYDADLEWLHQGYARDMGESGNLSSVVSVLERGGYCSPSADVVEAMIARLDWSCAAVKRARRVLPRWRMLAPDVQAVLTARYSTAGELPARANALLGDLATVVLWKASETDGANGSPRGLRALLRALERGDSGHCRQPLRAAEKAVREAHRAWVETGTKTAEQWVAASVYRPREVDWHRTVRFDARDTSESDYMEAES